MHIAFAIDGLHEVSGGAERVLVDVANQLFDRGHDITVITHEERNGPSFYKLRFGIRRIDVRPRHSRRKKRPPLDRARSLGEKSVILAAPIWAAQFLPKIYRIRRALKKERPEVIVGFMPTMFPYASIAALGLPTKVVSSVHNVPTKEFGSDPRRWSQNKFDIRIRRLSLRISNRITVLLPSFKNEFSRPSVKAKTHVIPNMIPSYDGPSADVRTRASNNTILVVGRLADAKNHRCLVAAWAKIENEHPSWNVKIIGKGPLKRKLEKQISDLKLERLSISAPTKKIMEEYKAARFLVMPSKYEGFGLVTAEAMSTGLPVIGFSDCSGTNEIVVDGKNGILVAPGENRDESLAAAISGLIHSESERVNLSKSAPDSIAHFSTGKITELWEDMLLELTRED